jgi:hypothetical protein
MQGVCVCVNVNLINRGSPARDVLAGGNVTFACRGGQEVEATAICQSRAPTTFHFLMYFYSFSPDFNRTSLSIRQLIEATAR